jgi:type IV pilus assembly protein PilO
MAAAKPAREGLSLERMSAFGKVALGVLFLLALGTVYFIGFYVDLAEEISNARDRETALQGELTRAQAARAVYQQDRDEKERREQLAHEQKKVLPDDPETPAFLSALQGAAIMAGVNLTSWSPTEEVPKEFYAKVPMRLTFTGKFHQVGKFFHSVGQLNRIINMENIHIKVAKDAAADVEVSVDCLATAFRAVKLEEAGAAKRRGTGR